MTPRMAPAGPEPGADRSARSPRSSRSLFGDRTGRRPPAGSRRTSGVPRLSQRESGRTRGGRGGSRGPGGGRGGRPGAPAALLASGFEALYGRSAVTEALRGRRQLRRLFVAEGVREDDRLRSIESAATDRDVAIERVPRPLLDDLTRGANHQGVVLEAEGYPYVTIDDILPLDGTVLLLDHLQDPQNFGTLLRAAEAAAVAGVVIPQNRAVVVTPAVVNASAGAVELIRVAIVPNLVRAIDALKGGGRWVVALDAGDDAIDLFAVDLPTPVALVVGGEGAGIGQLVRSRCDLVVSLPMRGRVDSLNASTAGAIALYEIMRRANSKGIQTDSSRA